MSWKKVILGGSFDHLHLGHQALINKAFLIGKKVMIGLAQKELTKDKFLAKTIEDFSERKKKLTAYLKKNNFFSRAEIIPIKDIFGPAVSDHEAEAIVVSSSTKNNALLINKKRKQKGLEPLKVIVVDNVLAQDKKIISSERIRSGEIDQQGKSYWLFLEKNQSRVLRLPIFLRQQLRRPFGRVFNNQTIELVGKRVINFIYQKKPAFVFTVGDVVSYSLIKNGFVPSLIIFDQKNKREKINQTIERQLMLKKPIKIVNQPGTINLKSFSKVKSLVSKILTKNKNYRVLVEGEEDLLVLPLVLVAPLKTLVIYGQVGLGVVVVDVNQRTKNKVMQILKKFS